MENFREIACGLVIGEMVKLGVKVKYSEGKGGAEGN